MTLTGADRLAASQMGQAVVAEITRYPETPDGPMEARVLRVLGDPDDPRTEVEKVLAVRRRRGRVSPTRSSASRPACRRPSRTAIAPTEPICGTFRSRPSIPRRRATSTTPSPSNRCPAAARGCGSRWPTSRTTCAKARPSTPRRASGAAASTCRTGPFPCCRSRCRRTCARWCPRRTGWRWWRGSISTATPRSPETDFSAAVIHSRARLDYPGVAAALGGDTRGKRKKYEPFLPALRQMDSLARQLRVKRLERGSLDFDLPEPFVELDHDDPRLVRDIRKARRDPGERQAYSMIEEFMLAANEAVAAVFASGARTRCGASTTRPTRAAWSSSRFWPRTTASRSTSTRRAPRAGCAACWRNCAATRRRSRCRSRC